MWRNKVQTKVPASDVMILLIHQLMVLLIHQLLISPALCTRAWVGAPGKKCTCLSLLSAAVWQLHPHPVLCSRGSALKHVPVTRVPRSTPVCEGDSQCQDTLQDFCSRLPCSLHIRETLSQPRDHIKPVRWRLSATQIKHTGADKQMLTVSASRHLLVCFLRCALLTTTSLGTHLLLFALTAFSLSLITEVHLGFSLLFTNLWLLWLSPWECPCPQTTGKMQMFGLL